MAPFTFDTSEWGDCLRIEQWLKSLSGVEKSDPSWLDQDFAERSPSETCQTLLETIPVFSPSSSTPPPKLFPTKESRKRFDEEYRRVFSESFDEKTRLEIAEQGSSNGHPLRWQFLALPPSLSFPLHAHCNIELDLPLVGDLLERRCTYHIPKVALQKTPKGRFHVPANEELQKFGKDIADKFVLEDQGKDGEYEDIATPRGSMLVNQTGSIHQSYTDSRGGVLIFVLWAGVHCNFIKSKMLQKAGIESLRWCLPAKE